MLRKRIPCVETDTLRRYFLPTALLVTLTLILILTLTVSGRADVVAIPPVVPSATKILILPTLDTTADRLEMQQEHIVTSDHRLAYEFLIRGFSALAPDVAIRAARTADIDLTAPDERTRKNLKIMGQAAGATWVVALTVMDVAEVHSGSWLNGGGRRAKAKVEIRIWDVASDTYIENKFYEDTKSTKRIFGSIGTTGLFRQAIDTTVQRSVQDILVPYPIIKHLREQFDENDVVKGEAASALASGGVAPGLPVLGAGAPITVILQTMLRSDMSRDEDPVTFHVNDNVYSTDGSHTLFIAKNAIAMGRVVAAKERSYAGKAGSLQFTCDYAMSIAGKRVYLRRDKISQAGHSNETGAIVLTALIGQVGLLVNGRDANFKMGTSFTLYVDQDAALMPETHPVVPAAAAPASSIVAPVTAALPAPNLPMTLFTMADGSQVVGHLVSFDGMNYVVATGTGNVNLGMATVKSMNVLIPPPAAAVVPAAAVIPKPTPRLPLISIFPQRVRVEMMNGDSYNGSVTAIDRGEYTIVIPKSTVTIEESRIKTLELLPANG